MSPSVKGNGESISISLYASSYISLSKSSSIVSKYSSSSGIVFCAIGDLPLSRCNLGENSAMPESLATVLSSCKSLKVSSTFLISNISSSFSQSSLLSVM